MGGHRCLVLCVAALLAGCVQADVQTCADGRLCPVNSACDDIHGLCVIPAQLEVCDGAPDGDVCSIPGGAPGVCRDEVCLPAVCGDGLVTAPEQCDGSVPDTLDDCTEHNFHEAGTVPCSSSCTFDTSGCTGSCGDGEIEGGEQCEPGLLGGNDCTAFGFYDAAGLDCSAGCTFDVTACQGFCGDEARNGVEACDPTAALDTTCLLLGFHDGGALACTDACTLDTTGCMGSCGDGLVGGAEQCDPGLTPAPGDDVLAGRTCVDFGFYEPDGLVCSDACTAITDECLGRCGDGVLDPAEDCDDNDTSTTADDMFAGDCTDLGYYGAATIACTPQCGFDDRACIGACGDRIVQQAEGELCDGQVTGQSCLDLGFDAGPLTCGAACAPELDRCTRAWDVTAFPNTTQLMGVWSFASDDVIAVGYDAPNGRGVTAHWDGTSWSSRGDVPGTLLNAVWASDPDDVFAVGYDGKIVHWDGLAWNPQPSGTTEVLQAVWGNAADDVIAVGENGTIIRYDGAAWSPMTSGTTERLFAVWGSGPDDVFVGGGNGTILHWDGATWSPMTSGTSAYLAAAWGFGPEDVIFASTGGEVLRWDGTTWSSETIGGAVEGAWGSGPDDVYLVGTSITHWDGDAWTNIAATGNMLQAVSGSGRGDVIGVGGAGAIWRGDGSAWLDAGTGFGATLRGATSFDGDVIAVSDLGLILRWDGVTWTPMNGSDSSALYDVWAAGPGDVFAVGFETFATTGVIRHYDGNTWSSMTESAPKPLRGVWGSSASDVIAVGDDGTIFHWDGGAWSPMTSPTTEALEGVWVAAPDLAYAVGRAGTVLRWNGTAWSAQTSPVTSDLYAVWGSGPDDLFAVGDAGTILHSSGGAWTTMTSGTAVHLADVWGTGPADVFAVGGNGVVVHWDGASWSPMATPTPAGLFTVAGAAHDVLAVGFGNIGVRLFRTCGPAEQVCDDDHDDDCDGRIDCGDPDCAADAGCLAGGLCDGWTAIACGASVSGSTIGRPARMDRYACDAWSEPGRERVYRITPAAGTVTVTLRDAADDLDLVVLAGGAGGGCDPYNPGCVAASVSPGDEQVAFDAVGGQPYYLVVDAAGSASRTFTLEVSCP